ncbi:MAG: nucleotidyltransferase domain-containing protein [Planctomycetia bacterium]|nr:nucleotidyltransferase domain-containing protein [Planctomycetia bacterium]
MDLTQRVQQKLDSVEIEKGIHIVFACEVGSLAWGKPSLDSDYDVRFIYLYNSKTDKKPAHIETPITTQWDLAGFEASRAIQYVGESNPSMVEWFASPMRYRTSALGEQLGKRLQELFSPERYLCAYRGLFKKLLKKLKNPVIQPKIYLLLLRFLMTCRWTLVQKTIPPFTFRELAHEYLPSSLHSIVTELWALKEQHTKSFVIPHIQRLDEYLLPEIDFILQTIESLKDVIVAPHSPQEVLNLKDFLIGSEVWKECSTYGHKTQD